MATNAPTPERIAAALLFEQDMAKMEARYDRKRAKLDAAQLNETAALFARLDKVN